MSPSPKRQLAQLKENIEDKNITNKGAREVQDQMVNGDEVLNPDNTSSVLITVVNAVNNHFEQECLDEVVRQPNSHLIRQSRTDQVTCNKYSI